MDLRSTIWIHEKQAPPKFREDQLVLCTEGPYLMQITGITNGAVPEYEGWMVDAVAENSAYRITGWRRMLKYSIPQDRLQPVDKAVDKAYLEKGSDRQPSEFFESFFRSYDARRAA